MSEELQKQAKRMHMEELITYTQNAAEYSEALKGQLQDQGVYESNDTKKAFITDIKALFTRRYDYVTRAKAVEQQARRMGLADYNGELERADNELIAAEPELTKEQKKALQKEKIAQLHESAMASSRRSRIVHSTVHDEESGKVHQITKYKISEKESDSETKLLKEKLEAIDQSVKAALETRNLTDERKLLIRIEAMKDRIKEYNDYGHLFSPTDQLRIDALAKKEELGLELRDLKKDLEILRLERSSPEEAAKARSSKRTHAFYDLFRKVFHSSYSIFHPDMSLSKEDAEYHDEEKGRVFINKGRAFFGGTKPMYYYKESGGDGRDWLYKEAVDCLGNKTPERAYITEGSSRLQQYLCGEDHFVPVFVAKNAYGRAIGTFQEQVKTMEKPTIDLFDWQKKVQASKDSNGATPPPEPIPEYVADQVLREHTLDWVICNFDTKGENFLQKDDGRLVSIDKEAAFSKIDDERSRHMSRTVRLHKNDTIYNVLFSQFVERDPQSVPLNLNFDSIEESIDKLERLSDREYLEMYDGFLTSKYGPKVPEGARRQNEARNRFERIMCGRKNGVRREYKSFLGSILRERYDRVKTDQNALRNFNEQYGNNIIVENGKWLYKFPSERL